MMIATTEARSACSLSHRERDGATRERGHTVEAPGFPSPRASARRGGVRGGGPLSTRSFSTPHPARCCAPRHPPHRFAGGGYLLSLFVTQSRYGVHTLYWLDYCPALEHRAAG